MKIVADQNIPLVNELFSDMGHIIRLPGRNLQAKDVKDADILLVRSITQVDKDLLSGSKVRFVGSCTIGVDHLDINYLVDRNIAWANAPGCNANAVIQYVLSAMAALKTNWRTLTVGVIGCGNIGGRLYQRLNNLNVNVVAYDPFITTDTEKKMVGLGEVLKADIISCHTPLTRSGPFPTHHMIGREQLTQLHSNALLINSGRGAVIDNQALLSELNDRQFSVVLDVWENEPMINQQLLDKVNLGTPHIAGYSIEGKEQGSIMVYNALCDFLKDCPDKNKNKLLSSDKSILTIDNNVSGEYDTPLSNEKINELLLACYDIRKDDQVLRENLNLTGFDQLRKNYLSRREYTHFQLPDYLDQSELQDIFNIVKGASIS